jgi:hypothetical protein
MPLSRSDEKKAEAAQKKAEKARWYEEQNEARGQAQARAEYEASPLGRAEMAHAAGNAFFQIELEVSQISGGSSFGSSTGTVRHTGGRPDLLGQIEEKGWHLEHVGYVFIETGSTTTNRVLQTGQGMVTRGNVTGIYLFRSV